VKDGINGIVIERDAGMLASRLTLLGRDPARLAALRRKARETILSDYSAEAARSHYLRVFEEAIGWTFKETPEMVK
jgi:glycosyltransferase involved in cell wall biosynthesis